MPGLRQPSKLQPPIAYDGTSSDGVGLFQIAPLNISHNNTTRTQPYRSTSPLRSESEVSPRSYQLAHASSRRASWTSIISPTDLPRHNTAPAHQLPLPHLAAENPAFRNSSQEQYPDYRVPRQDEQREYEPSETYSQQPQYHHQAHQTRQLYAPPDPQSYQPQSQYPKTNRQYYENSPPGDYTSLPPPGEFPADGTSSINHPYVTRQVSLTSVPSSSRQFSGFGEDFTNSPRDLFKDPSLPSRSVSNSSTLHSRYPSDIHQSGPLPSRRISNSSALHSRSQTYGTSGPYQEDPFQDLRLSRSYTVSIGGYPLGAKRNSYSDHPYYNDPEMQPRRPSQPIYQSRQSYEGYQSTSSRPSSQNYPPVIASGHCTKASNPPRHRAPRKFTALRTLG
ncbi:hypothetical protein FPQ18DRAFT_414467 [Pyronema domesticum]|nr:hypothetical protein FPQ18DRAFT_414467 [Pyronema domesticum]